MSDELHTGYYPRPLQQEIHDSLRRFSVLVCHRRFGKTVLAVNALIDAAMRCKLDRPRYGYVAPLYSQAKSVAWDYLKSYTRPLPGVKINESELWVELPGNQARIRLFGADNPDALRGLYFDGVCLDEVAQMRPEVWGEIVRPALADRQGWALFIGTPKGVNLFSELYYAAVKDSEWFAGFYPASVTKLLPESELEAARATMSDSQYRQEFECDFSASNEDTLIPIDLVNESSRRVLHESVYQHAPVVLGVDVARFGDDSSVIVVRQGLACYGLRKFKDMDLMKFAGVIAQEIETRKPDGVFVDTVGIGAGVVDRLRQLGYRVIGVSAGGSPDDDARHLNKRAEMWCRMRDWMIEGGAIPDDLELRADLVGTRFNYDLRGRIQLEKKSEMKKRGLGSPDCADALALTFAYPVTRAEAFERRAAPFVKPERYDPLKWSPGMR